MEQPVDVIVESHLLASDGSKVNFFTHGNPTSPAILIAPAFTGSAKLYAEKFGQALPNYYVVGIELRGHGQSGGCNFEDINYCSAQQGPHDGEYKSFRIGRLSADIHEVKNFLGLKRFAMIGHSMGMNVVYQFILENGTNEMTGLFIYDQSPKNLVVGIPEDVLFPTDIATYPVDQFLELVNSLAEFTSQGGYVNTQKDIRCMLGGSETADPIYDPSTKKPAFMLTKEAWDLWAPFAYQMNGKVLSMMFWNSIVADFSGVFEIIRNGNIPVLIFGGKSSIVPWKAMQWAHDQLPGSELMLFESDVGVHGAFLNPPPSGTIFMDRLRNFLDQKVLPTI